MPKRDTDATTHRVTDRPRSIIYGPVHGTPEAIAYELALHTDAGENVEIRLSGQAMYELWVETKNTPWPDSSAERAEKDALLGRLVDRAQGADTETLRDAVDVLEGRVREP